MPVLKQWEIYTVQHAYLAVLTNSITRACCSSDVWCSSAGVIINVLLSWQASCRANAFIQQCLAQGYLAWMVTKWEMFGHGWSVGFVYYVPSGQLHAPVKTGIWRVLFHLSNVTIWYTMCLVGQSTTLHAPAHINKQAHTNLHMHKDMHKFTLYVHKYLFLFSHEEHPPPLSIILLPRMCGKVSNVFEIVLLS